MRACGFQPWYWRLLVRLWPHSQDSSPVQATWSWMSGNSWTFKRGTSVTRAMKSTGLAKKWPGTIHANLRMSLPWPARLRITNTFLPIASTTVSRPLASASDNPIFLLSLRKSNATFFRHSRLPDHVTFLALPVPSPPSPSGTSSSRQHPLPPVPRLPARSPALGRNTLQVARQKFQISPERTRRIWDPRGV